MTIRQTIDQYWNANPPKRTDDELERDKWLIPGVHLAGFNRTALLPASFLIQMCIGSVYAWSGYNASIEKYIYETNEDLNKAPITFYIAIAMLGIAAAIGGPFLERKGPRLCIRLGAILFLTGNLLTALGIYLQQILVVYVGYGFIGGMGLGLSYISPVSPLQKWFPDRRGLSSGFAVCGFGGGAIAASYFQKALMATVSLPLVFVITGILYFVMMMSFGIVLRMPPPDYSVDGVDIRTIKGAENTDLQLNLSVSDAILSWDFFMIYLTFAGNEIAGLLVISKIQGFVTNQFGKSSNDAVLANAVLGGFNLAGRILVSAASDRFGRKSMFIIMLISQAIAVGFIPIFMSSGNYVGFLAAIFCLAFMYGGGFGVAPALLSDQFSSKNTGPTFGVLLTSWSTVAVLGAIVFVAVFQHSNAELGSSSKHLYDTNFQWILAVICCSFIVCCLIQTNIQDRRLPRRQGEMLRLRLPTGQLVRFHRYLPVVRFISAKQEDAEWTDYLAEINAECSKNQTVVIHEQNSH